MGLRVAIVMGSQSDKAIAEKAENILKSFDIPYETFVLSAHRNPNKVKKFAVSASNQGFGVIIGIAGLSAHLPGVLASLCLLPVIGVPVEAGPLHGQDSLHSIVQMPSGIPVATVGIGNGANAALLAAEILALSDESIKHKLISYRKQFNDDET